MPFKINSGRNKAAHRSSHSSSTSSVGRCEMSQGWSQSRLSFAIIYYFIHDSCQSLLTLKQSSRMSLHALSPSNYVCGVPSCIQTLPCSQANMLTPRPVLHSTVEKSCTHAEGRMLLFCSQNLLGREEPRCHIPFCSSLMLGLGWERLLFTLLT